MSGFLITTIIIDKHVQLVMHVLWQDLRDAETGASVYEEPWQCTV
jgi:hypothetical protein